MRALRLIALVVLLAPPWLARTLHAEDLTAADRGAIRAVVEDQLAAFQRDDGAAAFALASPHIREQFGTIENFMEMVRAGYQPVYRPREVALGDVTVTDGRIVQRVLLIGPDGVPVTALYTMEQQQDGSWRIAGCALTRSMDKTT
jgi:DNA-binding transcriptional LysR family regulator